MRYTIISLENRKTGRRYTVRLAGHLSGREVRRIARMYGAKYRKSSWVNE